MEERKNCWEYVKCGREINGSKVEESGVCPAAVEMKSDGVNHGKAAGRFCWTVEGTLCEGPVKYKFFKCMECSFFQEVINQEGSFFVLGIGSREKK